MRVATRTCPREMGAWSRKARRWGVERRRCASGGSGVWLLLWEAEWVEGDVGRVGRELREVEMVEGVGSGEMREVGVEGG